MSFNNRKEGQFLNASPDQQEKAKQVYQYLYEVQDESETGEIVRAIVIAVVMFGLAIAIAFHYIGGSSAGGNNGGSGEYYTPTTEQPNSSDDSTDPTTEDQDTDEDTDTDSDSNTDTDTTLDYVASDNESDYSYCLSPDNYATFETNDGDTIAYPKNFFTSVTQDDEKISFTPSQDYPEYNIYTKSSEYENAIEEVQNRVSEYKEDMDNVTYQYPSNELKITVGDDGYAKTVLAGMWDESSNIKVYYVIASDGTDTKILEFKYEPDDNAEEDHSNQDYMIDCLYRGTSFTGSTYQMRTYNQFMNDDLGEKK